MVDVAVRHGTPSVHVPVPVAGIVHTVDDQPTVDSTSSRGNSGSGAASVPRSSAAWTPQPSSSRTAGPPLPSGAVAVVVAQLREHPRRGVRQERRDGQPEEPAGLHEVAERRSQAGSGVLVAGFGRLGQRPGLFRIDEPVGRPDEVPEGREGLVELAGLGLRDEPWQGLRPGGGEDRGPVTGRGRGALAAEVAPGHRNRAVHEIAEVVGEIGVVAADEAVPADLRVAVEGHLAERHVARAVGPERRREVVGVEEIAAALAHPLTARGEEPAVDPDLARRLEPGAPEHRRPEDRVEPGDVLADHVEIGRPPAGERLHIRWEARPGDVVDQRVVPDVDDPGLGIPRAVLAERRSRRSRRSGTGSPSRRASRSRLIEKSCRPPRMKPSISLRR